MRIALIRFSIGYRRGKKEHREGLQRSHRKRLLNIRDKINQKRNCAESHHRSPFNAQLLGHHLYYELSDGAAVLHRGCKNRPNARSCPGICPRDKRLKGFDTQNSLRIANAFATHTVAAFDGLGKLRSKTEGRGA